MNLRRFLQLPIIAPFPPGMTPAGAANFSLEALQNNANAYAEAYLSITTTGTDTVLTPAQTLAKNLILDVGASGAFTITLPATSKILDALGPTIARDGSFYFPFYITNNNVGFTGTLTAADAGTTLDGNDDVSNNENGKWIVRVAAPANSSAHPTLIFQRISTCGAGSGGGGGGSVTSVTATTPVVVTPSPITNTGVISHAASGVAAGTYGDSTHIAQVVVNATGHLTTVTSIPVSGAAGGTVTSVTATTPIVVTPDPIIGTGTVSHANSGVSAATYGDATHVAQVAINASGHVTSASSVAITGLGGGTVTSIGQTVPVEFSVTGSPVTTSGTLAIAKATQVANTVWAGPTTGGAAQPTFRTLVAGDLPGGTGTVTSVAQTVPVEFSIAGSPVTTTGTLAITKATQSANLVWAGPASGGAAQPTFRALVTADIPPPSGWFTLTDGATITPDCANGPKQLVVLGGNRTFAAPTNIPGDGYELWLMVKQDGTGTRTATWNAVYLFFSSGDDVLTTAANAIDLAACVYNQADNKWYCQLSKNAL